MAGQLNSPEVSIQLQLHVPRWPSHVPVSWSRSHRICVWSECWHNKEHGAAPAGARNRDSEPELARVRVVGDTVEITSSLRVVQFDPDAETTRTAKLGVSPPDPWTEDAK